MQPHDIIHVVVGGSGWMSDPNFAARDRYCLTVVDTILA
jgi:hypothetical protein